MGFKTFGVFLVMILAVALATGTAWATTPSSSQSAYPERTPDQSAPKASGTFQTSAIASSATAQDLAYAMAPDNSLISGASFATKPPAGFPSAVSDTPLAGFPRNGTGYGILSTGDASSASSPNDSGSLSGSNGGANVRGDSDYDVTILKVDLNVPQDADCLSVDFKFLSEEFDEFIGSAFNDGFIAELDNSTWSTSGSTVSAPNNFASASGDGAPITVNNVGFAGSSAADATGTTYDGATNVLRASTPVTPGAHLLYLSIFDSGDDVLDSAVFVDKLAAYTAGAGGCGTGVVAPEDPPAPLDQCSAARGESIVGTDVTHKLKVPGINSNVMQMYMNVRSCKGNASATAKILQDDPPQVIAQVLPSKWNSYVAVIPRYWLPVPEFKFNSDDKVSESLAAEVLTDPETGVTTVRGYSNHFQACASMPFASNFLRVGSGKLSELVAKFTGNRLTVGELVNKLPRWLRQKVISWSVAAAISPLGNIPPEVEDHIKDFVANGLANKLGLENCTSKVWQPNITVKLYPDGQDPTVSAPTKSPWGLKSYRAAQPF